MPGPFTVIALQESLGKRNKKNREKMGDWETYLMERRKLGEGTGNGRVGEGDKYEGIPT